jgi:hypothetical protein
VSYSGSVPNVVDNGKYARFSEKKMDKEINDVADEQVDFYVMRVYFRLIG